MAEVLLNVDAGELPDEPDALFAAADLVNVACGGHAGDDASMRATLERAHAFGARAGAHPSYADRPGFGRTRLSVPPDVVRDQVRGQCARLREQGGHVGMPITHVKPHGALYHAANAEVELAEAVVAGAVDALGDVAVVGPPAGELRRAAERRGLRYLREGFADRGLAPDGSLVPRGTPGALLSDPAVAAAQAARLAGGGAFDTLCVHGDGPNAAEVAMAVRRALDAWARSGA